ncbi:MAG TPA: NAD(P)-dependent oxidoreductase [Terriglobia bacterium]|nr:NAD(P)-dependent oxidoreductase [Terriglobia bacterium]
MKLVLTGSESFIGKALKRQCQEEGVETFGIDVAPSQESNHRQMSICSPEIAQAIPRDADALVHLAAVSTEKACRADARVAFDVNVGGTINLVRAAQARGIKQFIFASTEWVYGEVGNSDTQTEDSPIDANRFTSEYALTKIVGERLLWLAHMRDTLSVTVLRFGIVYGPRPSNWSAVEHLFHAIRTTNAVEVGSLRTARRFIHVSDIASGILRAVGRNGFETFNLTGNVLITLRDIIEQSSAVLGCLPQVIERDPAAVSIRNPDNQRAREVLRWDPAIGLKEGLLTLVSEKEGCLA